MARQELREWIKTTWFQAAFEKWMELTDAVVEGSTFGMGWDTRPKRNDDHDGDLYIYTFTIYHGWNSKSRISDFEANMLQYLLFVGIVMKDQPISIGAGVCPSRVCLPTVPLVTLSDSETLLEVE